MNAPCPFCAVVDGDGVPIRLSGIHTVAFEPLTPHVAGHMLFVPRLHVSDATERPDVTAATFAEAAAYVGQLGLPANLITSVGSLATQTVFHLHVHVIPRTLDDGLNRGWPWRS